MSNLTNKSVGKTCIFYDIHFKPLHQSKRCGAIIDNRDYAHICVLEDREINTKLNLRHALK